MTSVTSWLKSRVAAFRLSDEVGQGLAEYALILSLVAVLCAAALTGLRVSIEAALGSVVAAF